MGAQVQRGFVLVLTLWVLAIIAIAASYFAQRVHQAMDLARQSQETAEALVAFSNTRAYILYKLATTRPSLYGWGNQDPIALDNRPYRGLDGDIIRLQDDRGLLNVNFPRQTMLTNLLGEMGVPLERRGMMLDTLLDYTDTDNFRRLNGAEAPQYKALGLPPPPNDWLVSPYQLSNIIGWRDHPELLKRLLPLVTASRVNGFNPNTAPPAVLATLPGANAQSVAAIIRERKERPFHTIEQLPGITTAALGTDYVLFYPGNGIRITQQSDKLPWALQYSVTLTARSKNAPWRIDYYVKTTVTYPVENVDKIQKLPALAAAPSRIGQAP